MTLNLSINMEVPDDWAKATDAELRLLVYEEYIRSVLHYHQEAQMDAMMRQRNAVDAHEAIMCDACVEHHKQWAGIANDVAWEMKRV